MRIRKSASKLLGSANAYASPPVRSASSESWDSQASAAAGLLCELNRSPWDLIPNLHDSGIIAFQEEEKEQGVDRGIMGNGIKLEEEPIPPNRRKEEEMEESGEKDKRKKKKIRRKRKEKEIETGSATATEATVSCKKSDGKGWRCKRPANLPHSLCLYHLTQLRSYSYSHSKVANPANGGQFSVQKKKGDATGDGGNMYYYYYYAGFGPCRRKRRGDKTDDVVNGSDAAIKEEEDDDEGKEDSKYGDEDDAPVVAGDDEEGGEDDGRAHGDDDDDDSGEDSSDEEKNRNRRKRGRKPVKARSLKSLL
ncbi:nucleolin-like [Phoenix dactylifera]|uniref:Nucleolin-like n=1 Tax=Phoenix dactylifera TaxID=42345 RepID=A0A8B7C987_PHODC|nr:nucleolin-like [Phoenix dactylifera]